MLTKKLVFNPTKYSASIPIINLDCQQNIFTAVRKGRHASFYINTHSKQNRNTSFEKKAYNSNHFLLPYKEPMLYFFSAQSEQLVDREQIFTNLIKSVLDIIANQHIIE